MFFHRLRRTLAANAAYQARTAAAAAAAPSAPFYAAPAPFMSAIPEEASVKYAPYNRKAQFIASRRAKQWQAITGRKPSIFNTRRFSKRPAPTSNDPMMAAALKKRAEEREAKEAKKAAATASKRQKKTKPTATAAPTRQSARIAAKQTGAPVQHTTLENIPKPPRRKGLSKKEMENFSNLFSSGFGMRND